MPRGRTWAADTGCFNHPEKFDRGRYLAWLDRPEEERSRNLFVTMPDVWGDAAATLARVEDWPEVLRGLGYRPAFIAQDGIENLGVPWESCDALFVGGSDRWRHTESLPRLIDEARQRGKWVHIGRVNSERRLIWCRHLGADSADGTKIAFGPEVHAEKMGRSVARVTAMRPLPFPVLSDSPS